MNYRNRVIRSTALWATVGALVGSSNAEKLAGPINERATEVTYCSYDLGTAHRNEKFSLTCLGVDLPETNPQNLDTISNPAASAKEADELADGLRAQARDIRAREVYTDMAIGGIICGAFFLVANLSIGGVKVSDPYGKHR